MDVGGMNEKEPAILLSSYLSWIVLNLKKGNYVKMGMFVYSDTERVMCLKVTISRCCFGGSTQTLNHQSKNILGKRSLYS